MCEHWVAIGIGHIYVGIAAGCRLWIFSTKKKTFGILTNKKIDFYKIHWFVALLICLLFWLLSFHRPKTLSLDFQRKQQQQQQIKTKLGKIRRREEEEEQKKNYRHLTWHCWRSFIMRWWVFSFVLSASFDSCSLNPCAVRSLHVGHYTHSSWINSVFFLYVFGNKMKLRYKQ